ncbi:restriction endonuclease subunit S [Halomonas sp. GT]|uniref:restriction endonuclease subunit S n=1 Tax=Halomonas sp. GT TaxID=1971364 RepID=UPI0009F37903|nr:restriction endonuclease subunit S [Halomonas sp. GT]
MSYPAYSEYKDSGVDWLREVPVHWAISALSRVLKCPVTDGPHSTPVFVDEGVPFLSVDGIQDGELFFDSCRYISTEDHKEFSKKASPRIDDILMGKAASVGKIARVKTDVEFSIWSPLALIRIDQLKALPEFCEYALKAEESQYQISQKSNSNTQLNIGMKDIPKLRVCFPPLDEQNLIAIFLDHETARIDALVEEQQRLIALLKEKRQAVISHAVTKGLDPDVPMKDSGVEWLGEVPEHWGVGRIAYYATVSNGTTPSKAKREYWHEGNIAWLSSGAVNQYSVTKPTEYISKLALRECSLELLPVNTLIVGMIGQGKTRGLSAITKIETTINQNLAAIVTHGRLSSEYLHLVLQASYLVLREDGRGGNQAALNCDIIADFKTTVPPLDEQNNIIQKVAEDIRKIDGLINESNRLIATSEQRRSALVSAAVTGKIDVRGWQPPEDSVLTGEASRMEVV